MGKYTASSLVLIVLGTLSTSAARSQETRLDRTRKLLFDTGVVTWSLDESSQTFVFTSLPGNCTLSISLDADEYKGLVQNITKKQLHRQDFFYIRIRENTSFAQTSSVTGFAAVNQATRSSFQFLPFRVQDVPSILGLKTPPIVGQALYKTLDISIPFPDGCIDLEQNSNKELSLPRMEDSTANIFLTLLLIAIAYNPSLQLPHRLEICGLDTNHSDVPFTFVTCCVVNEKFNFEASSNSEMVRCSNPDSARQYLSLFSTVWGVASFLFVPLLIKYLPETPEEWRKLKTKCVQKCKQLSSDVADEIAAVESGSSSRLADEHEVKARGHLQPTWIQLPASLADRHAPRRQPGFGDNVTTDADELDPGHAIGDDLLINMTFEDEDNEGDERVYLNADPEYRLSTFLILSYLVHIPSDSHIAAIFRRLVFLIFLWMATGTLLFMTYIYYDSLFENCFFSPQRDILEKAFRKLHAQEYVKFQAGDEDSEYVWLVLRSLALYWPLVLAGINTILLYFIVIKPKDVCQALSWEEKSRSEEEVSAQRQVSYPSTLYTNMTGRLSRLLSKKFWKLWWNQCVCARSPCYRVSQTHRRCGIFCTCRTAMQAFLVLFRFPFSILVIPFSTLPLFTVLHNVFAKPRQLLTGGLCQSPCMVWMTFPITILGVALFYWMLFDLTQLLSHAFIFLLVDILRNSETTLPVVVFSSSVLLYIRQAFSNFEDEYRNMKGKIFELSNIVVAEAETRGLEPVIAENQRIRLLRKDHGGVLSIPKHVFERVCSKYRPYRQHLAQTVIKLIASLVVITFMFAVTTEFRAFQHFSAVGENLLVALTTSIPGLLGMLNSEEQKTLGRSEVEQKILATIRTMVTNSDGKKRGSDGEKKKSAISIGNNDNGVLPETVI